jgi:hypothetical protein
MARIASFAPVVKERIGRHTDVSCGFAVTSYDGQPALLIETYGSSQRQSAPKTSQSLLLDERAARELARLIRRVFPGI